MRTSVKLKMDPTQKILLKRSLNKNGLVQAKFTKEVAKACDNYVPFKTGRLKNEMIEIETSKIIYHAPYAKKQYYSNKGTGRQGTSNGGLRGKYWAKRAWADKKDSILKSVSMFVGGKVK